MRHPFSLPVLALSLAAFGTPACLTAQDQAARVANPSACPVELAAEFGKDAEAVPVDQNDVPHDLNDMRGHQGFHLSIKNTQLQRIVSADLEVHGTSNKSRVVPVDGKEQAADAVRNVHLVSSVPADQSRTSVVSVRDLTSIAWINVIELRYADGSVWHAQPGAECRVAPDPIMLIAGQAR